jgi:hypothetical protein
LLDRVRFCIIFHIDIHRNALVHSFRAVFVGGGCGRGDDFDDLRDLETLALGCIKGLCQTSVGIAQELDMGHSTSENIDPMAF